MAAALQGRESSINPLWRGECVIEGGTREPSFFVRPVTQVVVWSLWRRCVATPRVILWVLPFR